MVKASFELEEEGGRRREGGGRRCMYLPLHVLTLCISNG